MQIYLAGITNTGMRPGQTGYGHLTEREKQAYREVPHNLESWHYTNKQRSVDILRRNGLKVFLDSGAFSAHTLGVELSVVDYVDYIKRNHDIIRVEDGALMASVLDGIGDPKKTWENQKAMEDLGVQPLPCFHFGEDERYLEWYVKQYDYITLGGMVGRNGKALIAWLDRIWDNYLVDGSGRPKLKVHAFGITSLRIMRRYPWYSVDSSSWVQFAAFGNVMMPNGDKVCVSTRSPSRHDEGRHFESYSKLEQAVLLEQMEHDGFEFSKLSTIQQSRAAFNVNTFNDMNRNIEMFNCERREFMVQELF